MFPNIYKLKKEGTLDMNFDELWQAIKESTWFLKVTFETQSIPWKSQNSVKPFLENGNIKSDKRRITFSGLHVGSAFVANPNGYFVEITEGDINNVFMEENSICIQCKNKTVKLYRE